MGEDGDGGDGVWVAGGGGEGIGGTDLTTFEKLSNLQSNLQSGEPGRCGNRFDNF
jgi:hypothetical protein